MDYAVEKLFEKAEIIIVPEKKYLILYGSR
jgi:hypothetical protein